MDYLSPCGTCLASLSEFGDMDVIMVKKDDSDYRSTSLKELLPLNMAHVAEKLVEDK